MTDEGSLRAQILADFEESIDVSEDVPQEVAELFTGGHANETFGDDDELLEAIETSIRDGDDR
jgi:hypothetical protein